MNAGSWLNNDNLFLQYGTQKAVPEYAGDYKSYGDTREIELLIPDMTKLTTLPLVQSFTTFFPAVNGTQYIMVEEVRTFTDVAVTGSGAVLSVGLGYLTPGTTTNPPAVTSIDDAAFVAALPQTTIATLGSQNTLSIVADSAASYIGTYVGAAVTLPASTHNNYITAKYTTDAFTAGAIRIRIRYRTYNVISQ